MTEPRRDNLLIVHWHDLGRYLGVYGHDDVSSPGSTNSPPRASSSPTLMPPHHCVPRRAARSSPADTRRATAWSASPTTAGNTGPVSAHSPTCCPNPVGTLHSSECNTRRRILRGSASTSSTYRTRTANTSSNRPHQWLTEPPCHNRSLLTAGFFETHRPYPRERYEPSDAVERRLSPTTCPTHRTSAQDLAEFYGSISVADAAVGRLLDTLAETGLDRTTWVVFMTDHGPALPRAKSTLYDAGTGIAMIVRPPRDAGIGPRVYDELFSGVDLVPTLLGLLGVDAPADIEGISHARQPASPAHDVAERATEVYTHQDVPRFLRSDPRRSNQGIQLHRELCGQRPLLDLPWDIAEKRARARRCRATRRQAPRPARELYDLQRRPRPSRTTCSGLGVIRQGRSDRATTSRCCSTTGARRPTTSSRPSSRAPELPSATPRLTCAYHGITRYQPFGRIAPERGIEDRARFGQ